MSDTNPLPINFLLVDDRQANLIALQRLLHRDGLNLLTARSGAEALELLLKHDVALALVDVHMPDMDGFELAELMRGSDRTRRIPIVFVTAGTSDEQRRFEGYEKGAVDFLQKPIENDVLRSKASVFFDLESQRQEVIRQRDHLEEISQDNARLLQESRQIAAELQRADSRKDEFLATLAHELRNPLSPILNGIELLGMISPTEQPEECTEIREMIERQVRHMVRLVDDLLEVSRITSGKIELKTQPIDLADVIKQAVETSRPNVESAGHRLTVDAPPGRCRVNGDLTRLAQVVSNLINNSARYTPRGGSIEVSMVATPPNASITVKDNGIGIPAEMLEKVFELFTQLNRYQKQSGSGLGIGLALVKRIVQLHDGSVAVASDGDNRGTQFTVTLPMLAATGGEPDDTSQRPAVDRNQLKILAVDDNADALRMLKGLLIAMGHDVVTAASGREGIELFKSMEPSCVFLDIGMPEMDGCEVARQIRLLPAGRQVRLFALTGWGQDHDRRRTDAAGFDSHLVKPVSRDAIEGLLGSPGQPIPTSR